MFFSKKNNFEGVLKHLKVTYTLYKSATFDKLTSVFYTSILLLIMNFVIT